MGDDPFVPVGNQANNGSSNAINYFISNLGRPSVVIMVVAIGLSLGLSVGAVVMMAYGQSIQADRVATMINAVERRTMDRTSLAEREARLALDKIDELKSERR